MKKFNQVVKAAATVGIIGTLLSTSGQAYEGSYEYEGYEGYEGYVGYDAEVEIEAYTSNQCWDAGVIYEQGRLGSITHYNGLIFGDFYAEQADVEGALAVGGTSQIGTLGMGFDFGAADPSNAAQVIGSYTNPNHYPTFLSRAMPTFHGAQWGTHFNVYNGAMVVGQGITDAFCEQFVLNHDQLSQGSAQVWLRGNPTRFSFASEEAINGFFASAQSQTVSTSQLLAGATHAENVDVRVADLNHNRIDLSEINRFIPNNLAGANMIVINVIDEGAVVINEPKLSGALSQFDLVVLNFPNATSVEMRPAAMFINGGMMGSHHANIGTYAERLLWNFPNATQVSVQQHDVIGSVFAPLATYNANGGSTNGMLIAANYTTRGGHELHAFRPIVRDNVFGIYPITPEVDEDDETFYGIDPEGMMPELDVIEPEREYEVAVPLPDEVDLGDWDLEEDEDLDIEVEGVMPELDVIVEDEEDMDLDIEVEGVMPEVDVIDEDEEDADLDIEVEGVMPELDGDFISVVPLPEIVMPELVVPEEAAPEVVAPEVVMPEAIAPETAAPEVAAPEAENNVTNNVITENRVVNEVNRVTESNVSQITSGQQAPALPQTGHEGISFAIVGLGIVLLGGLLAIVKKKA